MIFTINYDIYYRLLVTFLTKSPFMVIPNILNKSLIFYLFGLN